jgi:WASH complex subunit FAM21
MQGDLPPPPPPLAPPVVTTQIPSDDTEVNAPVSSNEEGVADTGVKIWERPWSITELKNGSKDWTLASDAGLLLFLKEFSQRLRTRTHDIEKQVDTLVMETKGTDTRMNNVTNDFLMLSNIQFVENVSHMTITWMSHDT